MSRYATYDQWGFFPAGNANAFNPLSHNIWNTRHAWPYGAPEGLWSDARLQRLDSPGIPSPILWDPRAARPEGAWGFQDAPREQHSWYQTTVFGSTRLHAAQQSFLETGFQMRNGTDLNVTGSSKMEAVGGEGGGMAQIGSLGRYG